MNRIFTLGLSCSLWVALLGSGWANADIVAFRANGTVVSVIDLSDTHPSIGPGTPLSLRFEYDTEATATLSDTVRSEYEFAPSGFRGHASVQIGSALTFSTDELSIAIANDEPGPIFPPGDLFSISGFGMTGSGASAGFGFELMDATHSAIDSFLLPSVLTLDDWPQNQFTFQILDPFFALEGNMGSLVMVPEPTGLSLLLPGLGVLLALRHTRARGRRRSRFL